MRKRNPTQRELLIRIDERVNNILKQVEEHNGKIDKLNKNTTILQTQMKNHLKMHKRDIGLIGVGLTILTLVLKYVL